MHAAMQVVPAQIPSAIAGPGGGSLHIARHRVGSVPCRPHSTVQMQSGSAAHAAYSSQHISLVHAKHSVSLGSSAHAPAPVDAPLPELDGSAPEDDPLLDDAPPVVASALVLASPVESVVVDEELVAAAVIVLASEVEPFERSSPASSPQASNRDEEKRAARIDRGVDGMEAPQGAGRAAQRNVTCAELPASS